LGYTIYITMLMLSNTLKNRPVMGLHSGSQIAVAQEPIIDPNNLNIVGWWCQSPQFSGECVLLADDVREVMTAGLAVNDESALSAPSDLARHKDILQIKFQLMDKLVKTKNHKLGKISDFTYDESMSVQKLYVTRPITKLFSSEDTLIIDRNQILEVTDTYILVDEADVKAPKTASAPAAAIASN
jgi:sporulation protein YlmC with PRC-barrel domain